MSDDETRAQLQRGLRIATLILAVLTVDVLGLIHLVQGLKSHDHPAAQFAAFAALTAVLATEAVLVVRRRPWRNGRRLAIAVVLGASALS